MSVRSRIEDAKILLGQKRPEGALLMILVAIAGSSRKRYPKKELDSSGKAFRQFLSEEMNKVMPIPKLVMGTFRNGSMLLYDILYSVVRNELDHEAKLPTDVSITKTDEYQIRQEEGKLILSENFIGCLANAVILAEENKDLFPERDKFWPPWLRKKV